MPVRGLDHVNIRTGKLAQSIAFYENILGMTATAPPMAADMSKGAYMHGEDGALCIHLVAAEAAPDSLPPVRGLARRGVIDHFALFCEKQEVFLHRLSENNVEFTSQDIPQISAFLIFVRDPNDVLVELNFPYLT